MGGAFVSVVSLLLLTPVMYFPGLPGSFAEPLALTALGAGALFSGRYLGRKKRRGGIKLGALAAIIMCAFCAVGALISGGFSGSGILAKLLVALICGVTGGVLGVNSREKY